MVKSIALNANHRDSKILKGIILEKLGRYEESKSVREEAEFLPETNWRERRTFTITGLLNYATASSENSIVSKQKTDSK